VEFWPAVFAGAIMAMVSMIARWAGADLKMDIPVATGV
jgi:hypothetical protein